MTSTVIYRRTLDLNNNALRITIDITTVTIHITTITIKYSSMSNNIACRSDDCQHIYESLSCSVIVIFLWFGVCCIRYVDVSNSPSIDL